ncbi:MAG TPA: hypothetical protein VEW93_07680 [Acidimicrobiales bacterium]|nr:hypothetical protein [Acidimicrobiales bacterium]
MMWLWVVALSVTAVGLVAAVRAVARADAAVAHLRIASGAVAAVPAAGAALERATAEAAHHRAVLHARGTPRP